MEINIKTESRGKYVMNSLKINPISNWQLIALVLSLIVSGCATMNKNECLNAQWQSVGYEDGAKGYKASRIGEYRKSCAEHNVSPDLDAYTQGRLRGLTQWCTPSNGYLQGTRGAIYNGICPRELETDFELSMNHGKAVYDYRKKIKNHETMIARLNRDFNAIEQQISDMEAELISDQVVPLRRRVLLDEIRKSEKDRELLRYDVSEAQVSLYKMRSNLNKLMSKKYL
ncbi:MAG: DUF2799 domain-containing protein [Desulfobulbaceae bacterium]|nr:DUF2799 domain-containing protein [Desulfobulbaceae bacterium]